MNRSSALQDILLIRKYMEKAERFDALSPLSGVIVGTAAVAGTVITELVRNSSIVGIERTTAFAIIWSSVFAISFIALSLLTVMKMREVGKPVWSHVVRLIEAAIGPNFLVGILLTLYLMQTGQKNVIPCMWMLTYGAGVCAAALFSYRSIFVWGVLFIAAGAVSLFLTPGYRVLMTGLTFGGLHYVYAMIVWMVQRIDGRASVEKEEGMAALEYEELFYEEGEK